MWTLELPDNTDSISNIDTAFTYKNGSAKFVITEAEKTTIQKIYDKYDSEKGKPHADLKGLKLSKYLLNALRDSYSEVQETGRLKDFRAKLFLNAKNCPCCGILPVDELDHFLPKSSYNALAIYASNIIPYCHTCNKRKLADEGDKPEARFIQAYYDKIPKDVQFLFANLTIEDQGLKCKLEVRKVPDLDAQIVKQMNFQMERVKLEERLMPELLDLLVAVASYIHENFVAGGKTAVKLNLLGAAKAQARAFGINDWRAVCFDALANFDEFCNGGFYKCLSLDPTFF